MPADDGPEFSIRVRGLRWLVRFSHHGQRKEIAVCPRERPREEALRLAGRVVRQWVDAERRRPVESRNPLDLYERKIAGRSDSHKDNVARYRRRMREFFEGRALRSLTVRDVEAWRDWLLGQSATHKGEPIPGRTLSGKSVREHLAWLSSVFGLAGWANPCSAVERPRMSERERQGRLKFFDESEMARLFDAARGDPFECGLIFLAYTGCRSGGLRSLTLSDLEADACAVCVNEKGAKRRRLLLTGPVSAAWDAVIGQIHAGPRADGYVFPHGATWCYKGMTRLCERAGVPFRSPHALRHTFASHALLIWKPMWPIAVLSKWLGHEDPATTSRIYAHWLAVEAPSAWRFTLGANLGQTGNRSHKFNDLNPELERETGFEPDSFMAESK